MPISAVQQSDSVLYIYTFFLFFIFFLEVHFESDLSTMNSEFIAEIQNFFIIIILYTLGHKILTKNPLWGAGLLPRGQWAGF